MHTRPTRGVMVWMAAAGITPVVVFSVYTLAAPAIQSAFGLTYDRMGVLLAAGMLGYGAAAMAAGLLLDMVAAAPLARGALLAAAGACIAGSLAPAWPMLGAAMLLFGGTVGVMGVLPLVFFTDAYPADRTRAMARWQTLVSLASVIAPLLIGLLLALAAARVGEDRGWRILLAACAPLFLGLVALLPRRSLGRRANVAAVRLAEVLQIMRRPMFFSILAIGMLHTAADNATYMWIVLLAKERFAATSKLLGVIAASYGLAYTAGRLLRGTVQWPLAPLVTIAVGSTIGSLILVAALGAPSAAGLILLYSLAGVCFSLNWPSTLGYAGERFPDRAGTVLGAINGTTGPATVALSALVGVISQRAASVVAGMFVPAAVFLVLGAFAAVAALRSRRAA